MRRKLQDEHEAEILRLSKLGQPSRDIAAALKKQHGLVISKTAITDFLSKDRQARARDMKKAVREHMAPSVVEGVDAFEKGHDALLRTFDALMTEIEGGELNEEDLETKRAAALRTWDRIVKSQLALMRFAGVDTPDAEPADEGAASRVIEKLQAMLDEPSPPAPPTATNETDT